MYHRNFYQALVAIWWFLWWIVNKFITKLKMFIFKHRVSCLSSYFLFPQIFFRFDPSLNINKYAPRPTVFIHRFFGLPFGLFLYGLRFIIIGALNIMLKFMGTFFKKASQTYFVYRTIFSINDDKQLYLSILMVIYL